MLILNKLVLENFGPFKERREFFFEEGINLIQAKNGKGKSTLLQAIEMLLLDNYEGSYDDYINTSSTNFFISLDFTYHNVPYSVELSAQRNKNAVNTERKLTSNENFIGNNSDAKAFLYNLFEPNVARYALISKQENSDNIVTAKDSERLSLIKKIKEYEFDNEVKKEIEPYISSITNEITELEKEIYNLEHKDYQFKEKKVINYTEENIKEIQVAIERLQKEKANFDSLKQVLQSYKDEIKKIDSLITQKNTELINISNNISSLNEQILLIKNEDIENKINKIKEDITKLKYKLDVEIEEEYNKKIAEKKISVATTIERLKKEKEDIQQKMDELVIKKIMKFDDNLLSSLEKKSFGLIADLNVVTKNIINLANGKCPVCKQACTHVVSSYEQEKKDIQKQLDDLSELIIEQQNLKKEYDNEVIKNQNNRHTKLSFENDINTINNKIEREETSLANYLQIALSEKERQIENIIKNIENSEKSIVDIQILHEQKLKTKEELKEVHTQSLLSTQNTIDNYFTSKKQLEEKINTFDLKEFSEEDNLNNLISIVNQYNTDIFFNSIVEEHNQKVTKSINDDIQLLTSKLNLKLDLVSKRNDYEQSKVVLLKDFPNYMIDESIQDIENAMNDFIDQVYYKSLNIRLRSTKTVIKLEYGKDTQKSSPATRLSGAEKKIVQLSFINYFNRLLKLKCLILDEPDSAMDNERKQDLYESLLQTSNVFKQMIIVTHSEEMKRFLQVNAEPTIITL